MLSSSYVKYPEQGLAKARSTEYPGRLCDIILEVITVIVAILQMTKLRITEVK